MSRLLIGLVLSVVGVCGGCSSDSEKNRGVDITFDVLDILLSDDDDCCCCDDHHCHHKH